VSFGFVFAPNPQRLSAILKARRSERAANDIPAE
jgi:beta-carotene 3-hydroxylase